MADRVLTRELVQSDAFIEQVGGITGLVDDTIAGQFLNPDDQRDVKAFTISKLIGEYVRDYPDRAQSLTSLVLGSLTPGFLEN